MPETVRLGPREQQIVDLLLQGCSNAEIAKIVGMNRRTVKAHFNRLFHKFGISSGIKRVKLATLIYRRQLCLESNESELGTSGSKPSSNSLPKDSPTATSQKRLGITEYVVKNYLRTIYDQLGLWNRVELALWHEARRQENRTTGGTATPAVRLGPSAVQAAETKKTRASRR